MRKSTRKSTRIGVRNKRVPSQKEKNQLIKMEEAYRAARAGEINPYQYRCPKCGKIMECVNLGPQGKKQRDKYLILCKQDKLKGYIRKEEDGSYFLLGIPADVITRSYRKEVHFYLNKICESGIFSDVDSSYKWLNDQFYGSFFDWRGVGEFDKAYCMRAIEVCVECLINNAHRVKNLTPYQNKFGNSYSQTSPIIQKMFQKYNEEVSKG